MFKVQKERLVKNWPAKVSVAVDNGKVETHDITLDLLLLDVEQSDKVLRYFKDDIKKVVKGWSGIGDANGEVMEFNAKNLNILIGNPAFVKAVVDAYLQANSGQAAEKNS
ncbi:hypothetical protein [Vibrio sp. 1288]|uniref:hypothetical protein n=1 Tax=Vibrio sp. 1288 TaxID=3074550 RepID=UPI00296667F3|nr:hypothetical protein [Vibrio sp. 1288]MDW3137058.1 hypothetical protein [Vibrio sp. 1288]